MRAALVLPVRLVVVFAAFGVAAAGHQNQNRFLHLNGVLRIHAAPSQGADPKSSSKRDEAASKDPVLRHEEYIPKYHRGDSLGAFTDGYLDWFVICYWGGIILVVLALEVSKKRSEDPPAVDEAEKEASHLKRQNSGFFVGPEGEAGRQKELAPNVWALNLVASQGKATSREGNLLSPKLVFVAGILMGVLQLLTLFLVVYDIDPSASPYTEHPSAPWKQSPLTVNCMKVIMTFFLGMYVVSEAADAYDNYVIGMGVDDEDLLAHRFFLLAIPVFHYLVTLSVILAGVSVVLSCQDVPNILYNSMAILFITRVDELFWDFFRRTWDIQAEWCVTINESSIVEAKLLKEWLILFPMIWGFGLLGRAWYRDQMPALAVRAHYS